MTLFYSSCTSTQNTLRLIFFLLSFSLVFLDRLAIFFCVCFIVCYSKCMWLTSFDTLPNVFVKVLLIVNFLCLSMTCHVLCGKIVIVELSKHVESCSSTTKKFLSPLPSNMTGWWFIVRGSHPQSHTTLWSQNLAGWWVVLRVSHS